MWLALACGIAGGAILAWYACRDGWFRRRRRQSIPLIRHRMQDIDTTRIVNAVLLAEQRQAGVPSPIEPTPTTGVANPKRRRDP